MAEMRLTEAQVRVLKMVARNPGKWPFTASGRAVRWPVMRHLTIVGLIKSTHADAPVLSDLGRRWLAEHDHAD